MDEYTEISVKQNRNKMQVQNKVYNLLTTEGGYYLPPLADTHYKFISQILVEIKKAVIWKDIKIFTVPYLKGLTIQVILQFACKHFAFDEFIPSYDYNKYPKRDMIWNIINITKIFLDLKIYIYWFSSKNKKFTDFSKNKITKNKFTFCKI